MEMFHSHPKKLLYIEDDAESREMMADILRIRGFQFLGASRGIEGIRIASHEKPDLILMDINLPDMNGYEVTTLLKSIKDLRHTPIIALSADTEKDARERTLTAGCEGFISKPINIAEFLVLIDEYLQGRKETVPPELEKKILTEYNIRLGEKLQNKIEELERANSNLISMNEELNMSRDKLSEYNNRLFTMNSIANTLRLQESPDEVLRVLPAELNKGYATDRCIIFEYDDTKQNLLPISAKGITDQNLKKLKFKLDQGFYQHLKEDIKVLWVKNKDEILDQSMLKIAQKLNSTSFLIGCITGFTSRKDATGIFRSIISSFSANWDKSFLPEAPRKLLIFIDRGRSQLPFATYEIRVLKSFIQTASIIYENMLLYHKLVRMLRVKEQEAVTDPLTGVYNYRFFQMQIEREILRAERHGKTFSIAMIDIDNFKQYNDSHGHLNGDLALKRVATAIMENIRKSDILARYGGDEFVIIIPELDKNKAKLLAEKLCRVIKKTKLPKKKDTPKIQLTLSLGIASFPGDGEDEDALLKKADEALYTAKDMGRNAVCISS
jgi:diguanylate cyclase (GGDEF)-like protein